MKTMYSTVREIDLRIPISDNNHAYDILNRDAIQHCTRRAPSDGQHRLYDAVAYLGGPAKSGLFS